MPPGPERRRRLQPCGTYAAAERHRRRGEPLDEACRLARNARSMEYYHDRRSPVTAYRKVQKSARARALADLVRRYRAEYELSYRRHLAAEMQKCRTEKEGSGDE